MRLRFLLLLVFLVITTTAAAIRGFVAIVQCCVPAFGLVFLVFTAPATIPAAAAAAFAVYGRRGGRRHLRRALFGFQGLVVDRGNHGGFHPHPGAKRQVKVGVQEHGLNDGVEAQERAELVATKRRKRKKKQ